MNPHFTDLVKFLINTGVNREVDEDFRNLALNCLSLAIKYKKSKVQSLGLGKPILEGILPVCAEEEPEDVDSDCPARVGRNLRF
jgi:importin-4